MGVAPLTHIIAGIKGVTPTLLNANPDQILWLSVSGFTPRRWPRTGRCSSPRPGPPTGTSIHRPTECLKPNPSAPQHLGQRWRSRPPLPPLPYPTTPCHLPPPHCPQPRRPSSAQEPTLGLPRSPGQEGGLWGPWGSARGTAGTCGGRGRGRRRGWKGGGTGRRRGGSGGACAPPPPLPPGAEGGRAAPGAGAGSAGADGAGATSAAGKGAGVKSAAEPGRAEPCGEWGLRGLLLLPLRR